MLLAPHYNSPVPLLNRPLDVVAKHVLDSLLACPFLAVSGPLLDLGTGAGLPGLVIKIVQSDREVWLVDARKKAVSFLHYVIGRLRLKGVQVVQATVGQRDPLLRGYFEVVTSRAVTDLERLWSLSAPLLTPTGSLLALKGPRAKQEVEKLVQKEPSLRIHTQALSLPLLGDQRVLVQVKRA